MLKYFKFTRKRIIAAVVLLVILFAMQIIMTGPLMSRQSVTTEAGNSSSAVIGILDKTEVVRQKFVFGRKILLKSFSLSFGSFEKDEVGDVLHVQLLDGNSNVVFRKDVKVSEVKPNSTLSFTIKNGCIIPAGTTMCVRITCSSNESNYETIPTLNTTNRTDPNTFMSTLETTTHKKSLNISYSYTYGQVYPLIMMIVEVILILLCMFEGITCYESVGENAGEKPALPVRVLTGKSFKRTVRIIVLIINPLVTAIMMEAMNGTSVSIYPNVWLFTWILLLGLQLIFMAVIPNVGAALVSMDIILYILGLVNVFVLRFRGTPFLPSDIMGARTAGEVADHYSFTFSPSQYVSFVAFVIWIMLLLKIRHHRQKFSIKKYAVKFAASALPGLAIVLLLYNTQILTDCGITDSVWNKVSSLKKNGFYMNYFLNLHYLRVSKPSGYSEDKVASVIDDVKKEKNLVKEASGKKGLTVNDTEEKSSGQGKSMITNADFAENTVLNGKKPNIILVMNESLADFTLVNDTISYNEDPLPYIHSMTKNTIKGRNYVSVFGAGTSNSEFEAMTGNTMAYFPSGSNVYQQFMHDNTFSLPSYLKSLGYTTTAVHPSSGKNWNRENTYKSMGFDDFITIDDFKNPEYIRYISDKESYKKVIEEYKKKKKTGKPAYIFDMTIQNHGGYLTNTKWKDPVYVENSYYDETKEYLSSIHVSDSAFKYLIDYFSKVDEPTVICMFGDHFPSVENLFYEELLGKNESEWKLDDIQKRFGVPYILWANYEIPETDNLVISNNYLENMLLKQAGLKLPLYNQYIEELSKTIPAMNVNGYMDKDGEWHYYGSDEPDNVKELLKNYQILQYGYYSDSNKNEMADIFDMKLPNKEKK